MSQLEEIKSNASTRKTRSRSQPAHSEASARPPRLSRVFSAQHIDDHSHYHSYDEHHGQQSEPTSSDDSDFADQIEHEDDREAGDSVGDEYTEIRDGVANEQDVEAALEKTKSSRTIKDPNLVSTDAVSAKAIKLMSEQGDMEWPRRHGEPKELDKTPQVGCNARCLIFYLHFACFVLNGRSSDKLYRNRVEDHERGRAAIGPLNLRFSIRNRPIDPWAS